MVHKAKKGPAPSYSCFRGHRLAGTNLYIHNGNRWCRKCQALRVKEQQKKNGVVYQLAKQLIKVTDNRLVLPVEMRPILDAMKAEIERKF